MSSFLRRSVMCSGRTAIVMMRQQSSATIGVGRGSLRPTGVMWAKKVDKKAKGAAAAGKSKGGGVRDTTVMTATNVAKTGVWSEDWKLGEDSEYPDWVSTLGEEGLNLDELRKIVEEAEDVEKLDDVILRRFIKLSNKKKIKMNNQLSAKK